MHTFLPGQTAWLEHAEQRCEIIDLIGSGRTGQVYRARLQDHDYAVKWYFSCRSTPEQRAAVEHLIQRGPPNDHFLWPQDTVVHQDLSSFGFMMPVRDPRFCALGEVMTRVVDPTFKTLTIAGMNLADNFLRLHSLGLFYNDISFANIFLDPVSGEILLCDNDSLRGEGEAASAGIRSARFMAPEVVRGAEPPSSGTDLHSLAVILFSMFMLHHPLEGRRERDVTCLDGTAMRKIYGADALFIFDPKHGANRPVAGVHNNATLFWNLYPGYFREIFTRAFTEGLRDPGARVRESEWSDALTCMRDQIFYCHHCGAENFLTDEGDVSGPVVQQKCWFCQEAPIQPLRLLLDEHAIVLNQDTLLYPHHLEQYRRNDYSEIRAEMAPHPTRNDIWGLKNVSNRAWGSLAPSGQTMEVAPGRSVSLVPGLRIQFGDIEGRVV